MNGPKFDETSSGQIEAQRRLRADQIFEVVRRDGEAELNRPIVSLAWSGVAAGLAIGFSLITEAVLLSRLPADEPWAPLVANWGYTVGFVLVILGRLQLFTENTITPVMPICHAPTIRNLVSLGKIWSIVFTANLLGASLFGLFMMESSSIPDEVKHAILSLSRHGVTGGFGQTVAQGIGAGFLIAALVWLLANARGSELLLVACITYVIALCDFAHVIAGAVEMAALVVSGELGIGAALIDFIFPAFIGNVLGGTILFTLITYGQIRRELDE